MKVIRKRVLLKDIGNVSCVPLMLNTGYIVSEFRKNHEYADVEYWTSEGGLYESYICFCDKIWDWYNDEDMVDVFRCKVCYYHRGLLKYSCYMTSGCVHEHRWDGSIREPFCQVRKRSKGLKILLRGLVAQMEERIINYKGYTTPPTYMRRVGMWISCLEDK